MPKYLCIRSCWDDSASKGNHRMYDEGKVYSFDKGITPPHHFVKVKVDEDGEMEVIGEIIPRKGATPKQASQDVAAVKEIVKRVKKKELPDKAAVKI